VSDGLQVANQSRESTCGNELGLVHDEETLCNACDTAALSRVL
jgi:hypothetical protein